MNRATGQKCPCGSGLPGKRTLRMDCSAYIACSECYVNESRGPYRVNYDEKAQRATAARRAIEARRDEVCD